MIEIAKKHWKLVLLGALVSIGVFYSLQQIANYRVSELYLALDLKEAEYEASIIQLADATKNGRADEIARNLIQACGGDKQSRFDRLLGQLSNPMEPDELAELLVLFHECAYVSAHQRLVMALRLHREVEAWQELTETRERVLSNFSYTPNEAIQLWAELAENELGIAYDAAALVRLQGLIIAELMRGSATDATEIRSILSEVSEVNAAISAKRNNNGIIREEIAAVHLR